MTSTNINIQYNGTQDNNVYNNEGMKHPWSLHYIVKYQPSTGHSDTNGGLSPDQFGYYMSSSDVVMSSTAMDNIEPFMNFFGAGTPEPQDILYGEYGLPDEELMHNSFPTATVTVLLPRHAAETYSHDITYAFTLSTWISGHRVHLCSCRFSRNEACAIITGPERHLGADYYECISFEVPDAFQMAYSDNWKTFRNRVCGEKVEADSSQINNTGSNLDCTLTVVNEIGESLVPDTTFSTGRSALKMLPDNSESLHMITQFTNNEGVAGFNVNILFNKEYDTLDEYLRETYLYDTTDASIVYTFVIRGKEDIFKVVTKEFNTLVSSVFIGADELGYTSWDGFQPGLLAACLAVISCGSVEMTLTSSSEFVTQEVFKYLIMNELKHISLDSVSMENITMNVINRIENKIIQVDRPDDYKPAVINPVFVRVQDASAVVLHSGVTENIVINLDAYKNKVKVFTVKVGTQVFYETARISSGVVFKVTGLSKEPGDGGVYYILSDDGVMVTSGKYNVE